MTHASSTYFVYPTVHGPVTIAASARGICSVDFGNGTTTGQNRATDVTNRAATQLQEYLAGKRRYFDLPLDLDGSSFQRQVWTEACAIPYGQTCTAADLAAALGKPGAHRSVGTALKQNKLAPFVPTHRVVAPNATGRQAKVFRGLQALEAQAVSGA